jgi:hypothetical protein
MNTGTCKKALLGLAAFSMLSACTEGATFSLLETATLDVAKTKPLVPLIKAQMVSGAVTLVPPSGYCIDPSSLTQAFALMARCYLLGSESGGQDAPIGILTASIAKSRGAPLTAASIAQSSNSEIVEQLDFDGLDIVRSKTETPPQGLSKNHLRATAQIDGYDLSLALFSPAGSAAQGPRGPLMLQNLVQASQDASVAKDVAAKATGKDDTAQKDLRATIAGLFK